MHAWTTQNGLESEYERWYKIFGSAGGGLEIGPSAAEVEWRVSSAGGEQ